VRGGLFASNFGSANQQAQFAGESTMTSIDTVVRVRPGSRRLGRWSAAVALLGLGAACSSSSSSTGDGGSSSSTTTAGTICVYTVRPQTAAAASCSSPGSAVTGADNNHCIMGGVPQVQATGACVAVPDAAAPSSGDDAAGGGDAAGGDDGSAAVDAGDNGTCGESGYGDTNFGTSAADDDCKYDVSYTSTPICEKGNVYFTVTVKHRAVADGGPSLSDEPPLTGASVSAEVYADDCMTIAPNSGQTTVEQGNGVYKVGPIQFSKAGKWIVRFHFNECCSDDPMDSPHGHAAFWVQVP
jgi:hypothetical protein